MFDQEKMKEPYFKKENYSVTKLAISNEDAAELIRLEEAMWRSETRFDPAFQEQHFSQDFIEFGQSGRIYNRQQIMSFAKQEIGAELPLRDLQLRRLDKQIVQILYTSHVTHKGQIGHSRRCSIWRREGNRWVMCFHQGTPYTQ